MKKTPTLSNIQIVNFTIATVASSKILMIQQQLVDIARQDAWISTLLGTVLILLSTINVYFLALLNPGKDLPEIYLHNNMGTFLSKLLIVVGIIYTASYVCIAINIFADVVQLLLLNRTPSIVIALLMILTIISVVRKGVVNIARMSDIIAPFFLISLITIIALSTKEADLDNIKPIMYKNTFNIFKGTISTYGAFVGHAITIFILRYTQEPKKALKWCLLGTATPMILYSLLTFMTILVFGPTEIETMLYPTLTLSKAIEFPITLLERLEILVIIIWIPAMFMSISSYLFANLRNITVLLNLKQNHYTLISYVHIIPIVIVMYMVQNTLQSITYLNMVEMLGTFLGLGILPMLTVISLIRRRKEKKKQNITP